MLNEPPCEKKRCRIPLRMATACFVATFSLLLDSASIPVDAQEPLHRLAFESYAPSPYEIYCFFQTPLPAADAILHQRIAHQVVGSNVNLVFTPIAVDTSFDLQRLPPMIGARWSSIAAQGFANPVYLCFAPSGRVLYEGPLAEPQVTTLMESPARQRLAEHLGDGRHLVLVSIPGEDALANELVNEQLEKVLAAHSGNSESMPRIELQVVSAVEPAEDWTRRMLFAAAGLTTEPKGPMVALIFGRGRIFTARVGEAIQVESLLEDLKQAVAPHNGPRDQLPGEDLLIAFDWQAAADRAAEPTTVFKPDPPHFLVPPPASIVGSTLEPPPSPERRLANGLSSILAVTLGVLFWTMFFIIRPR